MGWLSFSLNKKKKKEKNIYIHTYVHTHTPYNPLRPLIYSLFNNRD